VIEVRNIVKYHERERVLDDVTLTIPQGVQLGLIGPGGAGKSLLMKVIAGLVQPDDGEVFVNGVRVNGLNDVELAEVRENMGMLFQNYALFDFMTVEDNIAFPLRQRGGVSESEIAARVEQLLQNVSLPGIQKLFPRQLSGGMKKRVTFARAVIHDPPILFYDDPTAGLDPVTSSKIFMLLEERKRERGTTSLVITHDILGVRDICDAFAMIDHGRLIFQGTREEIESTTNDTVRRFWLGQAED
jgi:phospholipid/cholesterol/gamma-HCH transport system ATP-binding protein